MSKMHVLKTVDQYWDDVKSGKKTFEVRLNDRAFQAGDVLVLRRVNKEGHPNTLPEDNTGIFANSDLTFRVSYLMQGGQFGIEPRYCVLGLEPMEATQ